MVYAKIYIVKLLYVDLVLFIFKVNPSFNLLCDVIFLYLCILYRKFISRELHSL